MTRTARPGSAISSNMSIAQSDTSATKMKPSPVECEDALNDCKRAVGMLYCIMGASVADLQDKEDALGFETNHLADRLDILRAYFEMDKKESTPCRMRKRHPRSQLESAR
jgi:hypothetical protein